MAAYEKAVIHKSSTNGWSRPTADTCNMKVSGEVRPILLKNSIFFEVAGIRLEWPAGREATLGMLAGFSQISGVPGLGGIANFFLYLVD